MSVTTQRVVLITGASSGIGLACASYLAGRGFQVYGTSRRAGGGAQDISADSAGSEGGVVMLPMDVADDRSVAQGVAAVLAREGRLDIVVNNAGSGIAGPVEETSIEEAKSQFDVNFFGAFRVCREVLPAMRRQGIGYIVNVGSIAGTVAIPYQALYSASKFALEGLSEALRLEVGSLGIRVVIIQPGDHKTNFTANRRLTEIQGRNSAYCQPFKAALGQMTRDEQHGPGPEKIARLLHRIVDSRNPKLRYTVGPFSQRTAAWMKRFLPGSIMERGIRRYYHL